MPKNAISLLCSDNSSLLNASFLTGKLAEVVQFGAAHFTYLVHLDALDVGRFEGEDTLNADGAGHFAYGKTLLLLMTIDFDDNTAIQLDTLFVAFDDFVCHGDGVARFELGELFAGGKSFFSNLD